MTLIGVAHHNPKKLAEAVNDLFPKTQRAAGDDDSGFAGSPGASDFVKEWWKK